MSRPRDPSSGKVSRLNALSIVVVDASQDRAELLRDALTVAGYETISVIDNASELVDHVAALKPDVVLIDVESPSRDTLEQLSVLRDRHPTPVLMIAQDIEAQSIQAAVKSGVCAYSVDGISPEKVRPAIEVAMATFATFRSLQGQLAKAREDLTHLKRIDRAKYLLMDDHKMSEQQAHDALRKFAMDRKRKLIDAADDVIALLRVLRPPVA